MITVHLENIGARRFTGDDADIAAAAWAIDTAKARDTDVDDEINAHHRTTSTRAAAAILKFVRGAKRIVTTNEVAEATALSSTCCIRVLKAYAALGEVISHGQDSPRRPMKWEVA